MYRMSHPNILKVLEVSDRKAGPYYVMPYIEGGSLAERIEPGQPLPKEEIVHIVRQIADALKYAHSRGIIHRDLKPANILLNAAGHAYLTDFGLLRTVFNDSMIDVNKKSVEGTIPYLSPSAAEGKADDTRGDIYAFGAVLYEMLTGRRPYDGPDPTDIINKILAGPPLPIREVNPDAPADLVRIAENCMARELRDRYAEMADVLGDLERLSTDKNLLGPHGTLSQKGVTKVWKWMFLSVGVGFGIAALLFLANMIFGFGIKHGAGLQQSLPQATTQQSLPLATEAYPSIFNKNLPYSGNTVRIVSVSPNTDHPLSVGRNYDIEVTVEYALKAENGYIMLAIQRGDSITSLAHTTKPITKGKGKIILKASIVVPSVNSIMVFTPLYPQEETGTTIVDTKVYKVIGN
jgi:serine/threonine protein kinase